MTSKSISLKSIVLLLLVLILLPVLLYTVYELGTLSTTEAMVASMYRQQLDVVLFSINQYSWDAVGIWASRLSSRIPAAGGSAEGVRSFLARTPALRAVFLGDTTLRSLTVVMREAEPSTRAFRIALLGALRKDPELVPRLLRYREAEYRKLEPVTFGADDSLRSVALLFVTEVGDRPGVAGFVVKEQQFVADILMPRLREAAGGEFLLGVFRSASEEPIASTGAVRRRDIAAMRDLWLFRELSLGIRLQGQTVNEVVRSRFTRNIIVLLVLDMILLAGAWLAYRTMTRQVELVRMKSDFVSNVSHELRTPLSLIRMYAETLEMGRLKSPEQQREYLATILRETERLTRLLNNILNFSRIEAGRKQYRFAPVDLTAVVREVLDTYRLAIEGEGIIPVLEFGEHLPAVVADREAVSEAVLNLVDNALKYGAGAKYLRIATGAEANTAFVEVQDRGVGIAGEEQEKIFEVFYRVSTGLVQSARGTGLGLALVKGIMEAHHGTVSVKSALGQGSTFRLVFPRS